MKRNLTFRHYFLIFFFGIQLAGIIIGKFTLTRYFCWAPYDQISFYEINIIIDGRNLTNEEVSRRYGKGKKGRDNRSIHNIISIVRQYEKTYGKDENANVEISYIINGHEEAAWVWPENKVISEKRITFQSSNCS